MKKQKQKINWGKWNKNELIYKCELRFIMWINADYVLYLLNPNTYLYHCYISLAVEFDLLKYT